MSFLRAAIATSRLLLLSPAAGRFAPGAGGNVGTSGTGAGWGLVARGGWAGISEEITPAVGKNNTEGGERKTWPRRLQCRLIKTSGRNRARRAKKKRIFMITEAKRRKEEVAAAKLKREEKKADMKRRVAEFQKEWDERKAIREMKQQVHDKL